MLLYSHLIWGKALVEFFGSSGWNDFEVISVVRERGVVPSFFWYVPDQYLLTAHWLCNGVIIAFLFGFGGRVTALAAWAIAVSYANRASLATFGLDQILCILIFYLAIGPTTRQLSLDRWVNRRLLKRQHWGDEPSIAANVAIRLIQIHLCLVYLSAGLGKLQGEAWWNGEAMWLAIANYEYQSTDLTWLASYPRLLELMTHVAIVWEVIFAFLVWPKITRPIVLLMGVFMHVGIGAFLGMWTFGLAMIFSYVAFVPPKLLRWRSRSDSVAPIAGGNLLDAVDHSQFADSVPELHTTMVSQEPDSECDANILVSGEPRLERLPR